MSVYLTWGLCLWTMYLMVLLLPVIQMGGRVQVNDDSWEVTFLLTIVAAVHVAAWPVLLPLHIIAHGSRT